MLKLWNRDKVAGMAVTNMAKTNMPDISMAETSAAEINTADAYKASTNILDFRTAGTNMAETNMAGTNTAGIKNRVNGKTAIYGVIGNPISHTMSPYFQNIFFSSSGLNSIYIPLHICDESKLETAIRGLAACGIKGLNVTIPYKEKVLTLMDSIDEAASVTGAVNTIIFDGGKLHGSNTDPEGFGCDFSICTGANMEGINVLILGAGGAARSVAFEFARSGAANIYILNRTYEKAESLAAFINKSTGKNIVRAVKNVERWTDLNHGIPGYIVNTTPVGMHANKFQEGGEIPLSNIWPGFKYGQTGYDLVYRPADTVFIKSAGNKGCKAFNGLGMLIRQGAGSFKLWTGIEINEELIINTLNDMKVIFVAK